MDFRNLTLSNFRNFENTTIEFSGKTNLIVGPNGSGKSNILEAIFYLCTAKSFRGATDDQMRRFDAEFFRLEARGTVRDGDVEILVASARGEKKRLIINGAVHPKLSELYNTVRAVIFAPDDVDLVTGPPSGRRQFLDMSISQSDTEYLAKLWEYRRVLAQRNALLKNIADTHESIEEIGGSTSLEVWDSQLSELAVAIVRKRRDFIAAVKAQASSLHKNLSGMDFEFDVSYVTSVTDMYLDTEAFQKLLHKRRSRELMMGQTLVGPHRDDLRFALGDHDCRYFASRGQTKTVALAIKLAVFQMLRDKLEEPPILLLDEIYSDLDQRRLTELSTLLPDLGQVLVTTSKIEEVKDLRLFDKSIRVDDGIVS